MRRAIRALRRGRRTTAGRRCNSDVARGRLLTAVWAAIALAATFLLATPARAYTPESPKVKEMVGRAVKFLESASDNRLGGKCLIGLAVYKHTGNGAHPKVQEAVAACRAYIAGQNTYGEGSMYSLGAAIIFLCDVGPQDYAKEISAMLTELLQIQKGHGGWGYNHSQTGDTSQTQYGVLALWSAYYAQQQVPVEHADRVCNWLIRTQDPDGGWGYQGKDPGAYNRINQDSRTLSLSAAGLGSLYVSAHLLGFVKPKPEGAEEENPGLPALQKKKGPAAERKGPISESVDRALLEKALADGNAWFAKNFSIRGERWSHYYLYALERYCSFRDEVEGRTEKEPAWYNQGVDFLHSTQAPDGSWQGGDGICGKQVDTAFGVLFLLRGALKTIQKVTLSEGALLAGQGLPANVATARLRGAQVVGAQVSRSVDDFLAMIEDPESPDIDGLMHSLNAVSLADDNRTRTQQVNRLRSLVRQGTYEQRLVAVKALGRSRDIDNAPLLIYALTDPDWRVAKEAHQALCFIGRKFDAFPEEKPTGPAFDAYINRWKQWYLSVRPDAEFID